MPGWIFSVLSDLFHVGLFLAAGIVLLAGAVGFR